MSWVSNTSFLFAFAKAAYQSKKNLHLSKEQLKKLQQDKFRKLLKYISVHSPYYQKVINDQMIDITQASPEDFPILTKELLLEYFDDVVTDKRITKNKLASFLEKSKDPLELFLDTYYVIHTSGSSGTISYYVYTKEELIQGLVPVIRGNKTRPQLKFAYIAATNGHFAGVTMASISKKLPILYKNTVLFDINSPFADIIRQLNTMQPNAIGGYAFALRKLAEAQEANKLSIQPHYLQSGGEPLSTGDKEYIQNIFHAPVINVYASSEHLLMGLGKDTYQGMYMMEDNLIFEIHPGYTCITNLYNYTLPLIRYKMTDRLEPIPDTTGQMPFLKIKEIVGRKEATPIFINDSGEEDFISPILLVEFYVKNLDKFQIQLLSKKEFIFYACLNKDIDKKTERETIRQIEQKLRHILSEKQMTKVKFEIKLVDELHVDPKTGKFRLIIPSIMKQ